MARAQDAGTQEVSVGDVVGGLWSDRTTTPRGWTVRVRHGGRRIRRWNRVVGG